MQMFNDKKQSFTRMFIKTAKNIACSSLIMDKSDLIIKIIQWFYRFYVKIQITKQVP